MRLLSVSAIGAVSHPARPVANNIPSSISAIPHSCINPLVLPAKRFSTVGILPVKFQMFWANTTISMPSARKTMPRSIIMSLV